MCTRQPVCLLRGGGITCSGQAAIMMAV